MKYIRTKDGRIIDTTEMKWCECSKQASYYKDKNYILYVPLKEANTIEELCDELVVVQKDFHDLLNADTHCLQTLKRYYEINKIEVLGIYGAIWTDKGLIYVAKMKGVLSNGEIDWELL